MHGFGFRVSWLGGDAAFSVFGVRDREGGDQLGLRMYGVIRHLVIAGMGSVRATGDGLWNELRITRGSHCDEHLDTDGL